MPIKFHCSNCGQLLGIASRKAGMVVNCPKCQAPCTVPKEDQIDAKPTSKSANAPAAEPSKPGSKLIFENKDFENWIEKIGSKKATSPPLPSSATETEPDSDAGDSDSSGEIRAISPPWELGQSGDIPVMMSTSPLSNPSILAAVVAATIFLSFFLGVAVGRYAIPYIPGPTAGEPSQVPAALPKVPAAPPAQVSGEVLFDQQGKTRPDVGSVVLALPARMEPPAKLPVRGLRPEDRAWAENSAVDQLRAFGGRIGYVDEQGHFELPIEQAGDYYLIVISNHALRPDGRDVPVDDRSVFNRYFDRYQDLLTTEQSMRSYMVLPPMEFQSGAQRSLQQPLVFSSHL